MTENLFATAHERALADSPSVTASLHAFPAHATKRAQGRVRTALGGLVARYLLREAGTVYTALAAITDSRARRAAEEARHEERLRQYRLLHDTVLSTLSGIARGGLDHHTDTVRQRCAADADYVRGLISGDPRKTPSTLAVALATVGRDHNALGLRVHHMNDGVPQRVPGQVVQAFADAAREALNNVAKHAGTREAWLTATADDDVVTVTVVDRGAGFDPAFHRDGLGLTRSVAGRMAEVGGRVTVSSAPGEGTRVRLIWSPVTRARTPRTPHRPLTAE